MIIGLAEREHGEEETVRTRSRFDLSDGKKKTLTKLSQKKKLTKTLTEKKIRTQNWKINVKLLLET